MRAGHIGKQKSYYFREKRQRGPNPSTNRNFCGIPEAPCVTTEKLPGLLRQLPALENGGAKQERRKLAVIMFADMVGYTV